MTTNHFELKKMEHMLLTIIELLKHLNSEKGRLSIYTQKELLSLLNLSKYLKILGKKRFKAIRATY